MTPRIDTPPAKIGTVQWYVKADIQDYSLDFDARKDARAYKQLLLKSRSHITSDIIRREVTNEGYHV